MKSHIHTLRLAGTLLGMFLFAGITFAQECTGNLCIARDDLPLLEPLGSQRSFSPQPGISIFFLYFNDVWPWVIGIAAGVAVLQALVGGVQIMMSGSEDKAAEGKSRLTWAMGGIVVVAFAGFFLRLLNNIFFF